MRKSAPARTSKPVFANSRGMEEVCPVREVPSAGPAVLVGRATTPRMTWSPGTGGCAVPMESSQDRCSTEPFRPDTTEVPGACGPCDGGTEGSERASVEHDVSASRQAPMVGPIADRDFIRSSKHCAPTHRLCECATERIGTHPVTACGSVQPVGPTGARARRGRGSTRARRGDACRKSGLR